MTIPQILITYAATSAVTLVAICRLFHVAALHEPSPCERDAQDGRGEGGAAEFRTIHNEGISS